MFELKTRERKKVCAPLDVVRKATNIEKFQELRLTIRFSEVGKSLKTLLVTSSGIGEGKSTCASGLALAFAKAGERVLLLDAHFQRPSLASIWSVEQSKGLSELFFNPELSLAKCTKAANIANLDVCVSGSKTVDLSQLTAGKRMQEILNEAATNYDVVILDGPSFVEEINAKVLIYQVDGTLLVVREEETQQKELQRTIEDFQKRKVELLGIIYNGKKSLLDINWRGWFKKNN